ncbi:ABC-2 family transporter protein [Paenibacillus sp. KS-LC4]|uniref:ABC transporter permease n=1 Tax=Paenibacillus sp. KS-LC4 TaxID=2979727 RepID=UPI0030D00266
MAALYYSRLYLRFIKLILKSRVQYKFSFFIEIFVNMIAPTSFFAAISFIVFRLGTLTEWSNAELILMFGIGLLSWGITGLFLYAPLTQLETFINQGQFDLYLYKPIHPLVLLIFNNFQHTYFGHIIVSLVMIGYSLVNGQMLDAATIFKLAYFVINAVTVHAGILIFFLCIHFYLKRPLALIMIFVIDIQIMSRYPMEIFNKGIQFVFFLIPYIFVSYYPVVIITKHSISPIMFALTMLIGPILLASSIFAFHWSLKRYDSSGN